MGPRIMGSEGREETGRGRARGLELMLLNCGVGEDSQESSPTPQLKSINSSALQIAVKRREAKSKGEKERYKHLNAELQRIARRDKKASSAINARK